jgi:hypothetical protein
MGAAMQVGSSALGVMGALQQGQATKVQDQIKGIQLHEQAEAAKVRGVQTSAAAQQQFAEGLSAFQAIRAGQGVGIDSATSLALAGKAEDRSEQSRQIGVSNQKIAAITNQADSNMAFAAGRQAMTSAWMNAGTSAAKGIGSIYSLASSMGE